MTNTLATQLFISQTTLLVELQRAQANPDVCNRLATALQGHVLGMHSSDALVRPHLRMVEKYRLRSEWNCLSPTRATLVIEALAALPSPDDPTMPADDPARDARARLDVLIVDAQLAVLHGDAALPDALARVREIVDDLLHANAPGVVDADRVLRDAATDEWWEAVDIDGLEALRTTMRPVIEHRVGGWLDSPIG